MIPDAELNYWGDRFAASSLRERLTFEQFLALPAPMRRRRLAQQQEIDALRKRAEQTVPASAAYRDGVLVAPIKPWHWRRPWFFRRRAR